MANIPQFTKNNNMDLYYDELSQALINAIGPSGYQISNLSSDDIDTVFPDSAVGTIWYDTTRGRWVGNKEGVLIGIVTEAL